MGRSTGDTERKATLREAAVGVARTLAEAGFIAYFAGGCVRDRLMGVEAKDYDIATNARPEQVHALFPRSQSVGEAFGVVLVRRGGFTLEVATFRTDGLYSDRRRPDEVTFTDAEHDAGRRDFTINGLFEDPLTGEIIDFVGGRADIDAGVIRAIGDPAARLGEDHLRMLRAIRFAARFGFEIEHETAQAIRAGAAELRGVSRERIGQELKMMLIDANRAVAAWSMQFLGLDAIVLEEDHRAIAPKRLGRLTEEAAYATMLAAWLLDRHDGRGTDLLRVARRCARALMLSNAERSALLHCLDIHATLRGKWPTLGVAAQKRLASSEQFHQALLILRAEDSQAFVDVRRHVEMLAETELAPDPLITGDDLIAAGMKPGPAFKRILDGVYDAQLEGTITNREQAMDLARALMDAG